MCPFTRTKYDLAICSPQRGKLTQFLDAGWGWWGAPWPYWQRWPAFCGNGGFSLRRRAFITTTLSIFRWVNQLNSRNEDCWFCYRAADIYDRLLARHDRELIPAPREEALAFSIEMLYHPKLFGIHQFWTNLHPPNATALRTLLVNCPEALHIIPDDVIARRPDFRAVFCDLMPSISGCQAQIPTSAAVPTVHLNEPCNMGKLLNRRRKRRAGARKGREQLVDM